MSHTARNSGPRGVHPHTKILTLYMVINSVEAFTVFDHLPRVELHTLGPHHYFIQNCFYYTNSFTALIYLACLLNSLLDN